MGRIRAANKNGEQIKKGSEKMKCCASKSLEILLICECYECGDIEEVKRERKVCPFDKECNSELFHYQRERCVNCDYADYYCEDVVQ